jgi:hypothetical protein
MSEPSAARSPLDLLADLTVYAPLGLALTVAETVPELARKGRARAEQQFGLARTVGQFALNRGARQGRSAAGAAEASIGALARKLLSGAVSIPFAERGRGRDACVPPVDLAAEDPTVATAAAGAATSRRTVAGAAGSVVGKPPSVEGLAIPSYDSLSAPQVVQRLAGLAPDEIRAVRAYEAATRGRRTIIARADQLLG